MKIERLIMALERVRDQYGDVEARALFSETDAIDKV